MVVIAISVKSPVKKVIVANLIVIPLVMFIAEGTCAIINYLQTTDTESISYTPKRPHDFDKFLGYTAKPNLDIHAIARQKEKVIYDVHYKIDKNGLRYTPSSNENSDQCIFFFGDSYIYGEGLNDNQTLPNQLGEKTHHKYKMYNFAYSGYGPQQMLSAIEHGVIDKKTSGCKSSIIIYDGMPDHIRRVAGKRFWSLHDPEYDLVNNKVVYRGSFADHRFNCPLKLKNTLSKSQVNIFINRRIINKNFHMTPNEEIYYTKLYTDILKQSKELAKQKYNTKRFIILFWNLDYEDAFKHIDIQKNLITNSLETYPIGEILPGYDSKNSKYLIKYEAHPNQLANETIAEFLAKRLASKN